MPSSTLRAAIDRYVRLVGDSRSENTRRTYAQEMTKLVAVLKTHGVVADQAAPTEATKDWVLWYVAALKPYAPATESLFLTALVGFYEYLVAEESSVINLVQVRSMLKRRQRKVTPRLPQFPREQIESVISYVNTIASAPSKDDKEHLRRLRDRAFILTLSDTGLRISEACRLTRGHIDWEEGRAIVTIKGGRERVGRV